MRSLRSVFERDPRRYDLLISQPWLQDGLTDEEIALVVVLHSVVASEQLFGDFIEGGHVQSETLSLDLAGEVTLFAVSRTPLRPDNDMLEGMRFGVDALEDFMGAPWPKADVIALFEPELYPPAGRNSGSHIVLTNTSRILLYHELAHFYFGGNVPFWLSEGAAVFFSLYTLQLTGSKSLLPYYDTAQINVVSGCAQYGVTNVQEWNEAPFSSPAKSCAYSIGMRFVIGMYEYLGHEVVSSSMRELYRSWESTGSRASEEQIYLSFLSNTPPPKQDDFRDLYLCLHGRPIPGYSARPSVTPSEQRAALVALYNATGGASWNDNSNWLSESPVNQWYRVFTDCNGGVTSLRLPSNQLSGPIPQEVGNLSDLRDLSLRDNELTGRIPAELGNLTNLHALRLEINQLTGPIPPELSRLTKLESLTLNNNQLTGGIPAELGNLLNLEDLWLRRNQLTGEIPAELGSLPNLQSLGLNRNQLTGTIPTELGSLTELQSLYASDNRLTGSIPAELGGLSRLEWLTLSDNQLTGTIPPELGNLNNLEALYIAYNQLSGEIPSELGNLNNLETLYIRGNNFTGCIPASLRNIPDFDFYRTNLKFCDE